MPRKATHEISWAVAASTYTSAAVVAGSARSLPSPVCRARSATKSANNATCGSTLVAAARRSASNRSPRPPDWLSSSTYIRAMSLNGRPLVVVAVSDNIHTIANGGPIGIVAGGADAGTASTEHWDAESVVGGEPSTDRIGRIADAWARLAACSCGVVPVIAAGGGGRGTSTVGRGAAVVVGASDGAGAEPVVVSTLVRSVVAG